MTGPMRFGGAAIHVRYLGPTYARGSRWVATADLGADRIARAVVSYDHATDAGSANAVRAARELMRQNGMPEHASLICGAMPDGSYVFIRDGAE